MRRLAPYFGPLLLIIFFGLLFWEVIFKGLVPISTDIMVGAYFPWLNSRWGYEVGVPVKNALLSDPFSAFFIQKHLVADLLKSWTIPLWNPYILAGTPLLAAYHTNPFFPANWLLLLPQLTGWRLFIGLSPLMAALSMYLFLHTHLRSTPAKMSGSVIFALSGLMTTWLELGTAVWAMAVLPLILFSLDRIITGKNHHYLPLFSVTIALLIFAGNVQIVTYAALLVAGYSFFLSRQHPTNWLSLSFFGFLGIGLAAIQLLPTLDLYQHSIRAEESYSTAFNFGLVKLPQLVRLWAADFFGNPSTGNHWGEYEYQEYSSFLGTLTLPLALVTFIATQKSRLVRFFQVTFLVSLVMVTLHPVSQLFFSLPLPLLTYSLASRIFFITNLSAAVLVASSLDQFINRGLKLKFASLLAAVFMALTAIAVYLAPVSHQSVAFRNSILPLLILSVLLVSALLKLPRRILVVILVSLILFDLGRYFRKFTPFVSPDLVYPTTPALEFVQNQPGLFRIARENTNLLPPNTWAAYGLESVEGYEPLRLQSYSRLFHLLENNPYFSRASRFSQLEDVNPVFLSALNVKYFFIVNLEQPTAVQAKLLDAGFQPVFTEGKVEVLENPNVLPRAYFVEQVISVSSEQELAERLESPDFDPSHTALLSPSGSVPEVGSVLPPLFTDMAIQPSGSVPEVTLHSANRVIIETSAATDQFMVLADSFDNGWKLTVDGQKQPIYRVNGALRGVVVPPGRHQLIFNYLPDSFIYGAWISLSSLILLLAALLQGRTLKDAHPA